MKLFRTEGGAVVEREGKFYSAGMLAWDDLLAREDVRAYLDGLIDARKLVRGRRARKSCWRRWGIRKFGRLVLLICCGREARIEEESEGGGDFYDRVYAADPARSCFSNPQGTG